MKQLVTFASLGLATVLMAIATPAFAESTAPSVGAPRIAAADATEGFNAAATAARAQKTALDARFGYGLARVTLNDALEAAGAATDDTRAVYVWASHLYLVWGRLGGFYEGHAKRLEALTAMVGIQGDLSGDDWAWISEGMKAWTKTAARLKTGLDELVGVRVRQSRLRTERAGWQAALASTGGVLDDGSAQAQQIAKATEALEALEAEALALADNLTEDARGIFVPELKPEAERRQYALIAPALAQADAGDAATPDGTYTPAPSFDALTAARLEGAVAAVQATQTARLVAVKAWREARTSAENNDGPATRPEAQEARRSLDATVARIAELRATIGAAPLGTDAERAAAGAMAEEVLTLRRALPHMKTHATELNSPAATRRWRTAQVATVRGLEEAAQAELEAYETAKQVLGERIEAAGRGRTAQAKKGAPALLKGAQSLPTAATGGFPEARVTRWTVRSGLRLIASGRRLNTDERGALTGPLEAALANLAALTTQRSSVAKAAQTTMSQADAALETLSPGAIAKAWDGARGGAALEWGVAWLGASADGAIVDSFLAALETTGKAPWGGIPIERATRAAAQSRDEHWGKSAPSTESAWAALVAGALQTRRGRALAGARAGIVKRVLKAHLAPSASRADRRSVGAAWGLALDALVLQAILVGLDGAIETARSEVIAAAQSLSKGIAPFDRSTGLAWTQDAAVPEGAPLSIRLEVVGETPLEGHIAAGTTDLGAVGTPTQGAVLVRIERIPALSRAEGPGPHTVVLTLLPEDIPAKGRGADL